MIEFYFPKTGYFSCVEVDIDGQKMTGFTRIALHRKRTFLHVILKDAVKKQQQACNLNSKPRNESLLIFHTLKYLTISVDYSR